MSSFKYKNTMPTPEEWRNLRSFTNWSLYDDNIFDEAKKHTIYAITVYDKEQIIGMGRVVGDGVICFYIQDIIVNPLYRNNGIGKKIVNSLMSEILKNSCPNSVIGLMSSIDTEPFYEKLGFIKRPNATMGAGMVYLSK